MCRLQRLLFPTRTQRGALSGLSLLLVTSRRSGDGELSQSDEQNGTAEVP